VSQQTPPGFNPTASARGVHLRWAFRRELGFPWYGFYFFRRDHLEGRPICLSEAIAALGLQPGPLASGTLDTPLGRIGSDQNLTLTDRFLPAGAKLDLALGQTVLLALSAEQVARQVEVRLGFAASASVEVTALLWDVPVAQSVVAGGAGATQAVSPEFDAITAVRVGPGPATLVDLCIIPVAHDATIGWRPPAGFPYPLCLLVRQPDYPCTAGHAENLLAARGEAGSRIRYGNPAN